jgi:hypothetical protein
MKHCSLRKSQLDSSKICWPDYWRNKIRREKERRRMRRMKNRNSRQKREENEAVNKIANNY